MASLCITVRLKRKNGKGLGLSILINLIANRFV